MPQATRAYANSWDDVALGKQMAETMIADGADTLFVYANQVGLGSIQAASEKGAKFVGFSSDQNSVAPGTVVGSVAFDFETFYTWAVDMFLNGNLAETRSTWPASKKEFSSQPTLISSAMMFGRKLKRPWIRLPMAKLTLSPCSPSNLDDSKETFSASG